MNETKKKVLIVEDDPLLEKMYEAKFASENFMVLKASDGEEGLKVSLLEHPDFIILDIMMPRLSGIDMLKMLREDAWGKSASVIVLSNLSSEIEMATAKSLGVKEYLIKANFTPHELVEKVRTYIT